MSTEYSNAQATATEVALAVSPDVSEQSETDALVLSVTAFDNENDNIPQQHQRTWGEVCRRFSKSQLRNKKAGTPTWSPTLYKPGATRGNAGVESISCAVIDIDNGTPLQDVLAKIDGYAFLAHSSFRHTEDHPKYRVILPLKTPSMAAQWPVNWARINHWLGEINDPATKDAARIYFIPCHPQGATHFVETSQGKPLDIDELPELPAEIASKVESTPSSKVVNKVKIVGLEEVVSDLSPAKGLAEMLSRCVFMQSVSSPEQQNDVSEPLWTAMLTNAGCFHDSDAWIHEASCHHDGYDEIATENRIERFRNNYAPVTCQRIQSLGFTRCPRGGCLLPSGVATKAPAGLWTWLLKKPYSLPFELLD